MRSGVLSHGNPSLCAGHLICMACTQHDIAGCGKGNFTCYSMVLNQLGPDTLTAAQLVAFRVTVTRCTE